jgi:hypothetical protein
MSRLTKFVLGLLILFGAFWVAFLLAMRTKYPPLQDAVRRMNREIVNPKTMETAGKPGAYASVVRHVGRTSGTTYETPILALEAHGGFVTPLPYGTKSDWLKNLLAAGSAIVVHDGTTYRVDEPEIIPAAEAAPFVPAQEQRTHRWFGVDQFLRVHRAEVTEPSEDFATQARDGALTRR